MGMIAVSMVVFIVLKCSINSSVRYLNESTQSRGECYYFGWFSGAAISAGVLCLTILLYCILIFTAKYWMIEDRDDAKELLGFYFVMMSFVWGILSGAAFYR